MRRRGIAGALGVACVGVCLMAPPAARADFTETTCGGGVPATQWTLPSGTAAFGGTLDSCGTGGPLEFILNSRQLGPGTAATAEIQMPPNEVLTAVNATYSTEATSGSGTQLFISADASDLAVAGTGQSDATYSSVLSDASTFGFTIYCTGNNASSPDCSYAGFDPLDVGQITLTIHDTGVPSVAAAGGSLATRGTYAGLQTLGFSAQDAGSGVAKVTATLGTTPVATAQGDCQSFELSPCPHALNGTLTIDTSELPNGSYPVTLTADDESGDPTTVAVDTVTVRNTGTVAVAPRHPRRGQVGARIVAGWNFGHPPLTRLTSLRFQRLPHPARIGLRCRGRGCPRRSWSSGRRVRRFERRLVGTRFRAGDRLTFTIRGSRHRRAERIAIEIRDGRRPAGRVLR